MTIEIKKPELEAIIQQQLQSGLFHDIDELLTEALHALRENAEPKTSHKPPKRLVDILSAPPFAESELGAVLTLAELRRGIELLDSGTRRTLGTLVERRTAPRV